MIIRIQVQMTPLLLSPEKSLPVHGVDERTTILIFCQMSPMLLAKKVAVHQADDQVAITSWQVIVIVDTVLRLISFRILIIFLVLDREESEKILFRVFLRNDLTGL